MQLFQRLKKVRHIEWILLALAAGALILSFTWDIGAKASIDNPSTAFTQQEMRLATILSNIQGVGQVSVYLYEREAEKAVSAFAPQAEGQAAPYESCIVVAQGAQDLMVKTQLMRAVMTALKLPASAVEIFNMEEELK